MSAFVVFDTETTGLPSNYDKFKFTNWHNWNSCRLVQLAWEIYNSPDDDTPVSKGCHLVIPETFTIPAKASSIHGITTEDARMNGRPLSEVLTLFMTDIKKYEVATAVAHNIAFDDNVIMSEMYRAGMNVSDWSLIYKYCTMLAGTVRGGRWPKLSALYKRLVGPLEDSVALHRADEDTRLCAAIYKAQQLS